MVSEIKADKLLNQSGDQDSGITSQPMMLLQ